MCEYCGCRQIEPLAQLMDEHLALLDLGGDARRHLAAGRRREAWAVLGELADQLVAHVDREERGVFRALKDQGDFADAVVALEREHREFDEAIADLGLDDPALEARVSELVDHLVVHIDKEDLGIFPVATVTLGADGWDTVAAAHRTDGDPPS